MTRGDLEHVIRAVGAIIGKRIVYVVGSQSLLGKHPDIGEMPARDGVDLGFRTGCRTVLAQSVEADMLFTDNVDLELIEGALGEMSLFHIEHGYYAHGLDMTSVVLPRGWRDRTCNIKNENTNGVEGRCLEPHDLILSKLYANREKDKDFFRSAARLGLLKIKTLVRRIAVMPIGDEDKKRLMDVVKMELGDG